MDIVRRYRMQTGMKHTHLGPLVTEVQGRMQTTRAGGCMTNADAQLQTRDARIVTILRLGRKLFAGEPALTHQLNVACTLAQSTACVLLLAVRSNQTLMPLNTQFSVRRRKRT